MSYDTASGALMGTKPNCKQHSSNKQRGPTKQLQLYNSRLAQPYIQLESKLSKVGHICRHQAHKWANSNWWHTTKPCSPAIPKLYKKPKQVESMLQLLYSQKHVTIFFPRPSFFNYAKLFSRNKITKLDREESQLARAHCCETQTQWVQKKERAVEAENPQAATIKV